MAGAVTEAGAAFMAGVEVVADSTAEAVVFTVVAEVVHVQAAEAGPAGEGILHRPLVTEGHVLRCLHLCGQEAGSRLGRGTTSIARAEILRVGTNALGTTAPLPLPLLTGSGIRFPARQAIVDRSVLNLR